jgi:hypothetical protein
MYEEESDGYIACGVVLGLLIIQTLVALRLECVHRLTITMMCFGAVCWAGISLFALEGKVDDERIPPLARLLIFATTIVVIVAIFVPLFVTFALWANAVLSAAMLIVGICQLLPSRKSHMFKVS